MYGIINKAVEDMIVNNYGQQQWAKIKLAAGIDSDIFLSTEPYDDSVTLKLVGLASRELHIPESEVLFNFGKFWVLGTAHDNYGLLMKAAGDNLHDFLLNLPHFHDRIALIFSKSRPPEFRTIEIKTNSIEIHYFSQRDGLSHFVRGLLQGLGEYFNKKIEIITVQARDMDHDHDIFIVNW